MGSSTPAFRCQRAKLICTLIFFELSFLLRFMWDIVIVDLIYENSSLFAYFMIYDVIVLAEGLSFLALFVFHNKNFTRKATPNSP